MRGQILLQMLFFENENGKILQNDGMIKRGYYIVLHLCDFCEP